MKRWTENERREWIQRRQREPGIWLWIHRLGSLRMAMLLIVTIAAACAFATFYESKFTTKVAQAHIYSNPLFMLWLVVLCVNLAAAALTRWPWQRKHTGFVITHTGIIILLVGGMVGRLFGFEAGVTLSRGQPNNQLVKNRTILQATSPEDGAVYTMPFEVELRKPNPEGPATAPLPGTELTLFVDGYTENLAARSQLVPAADADAGPAVELVFTSGMMQQASPVLLAATPPEAAVNEFFGRAHIELLPELPPAADRSAYPEATFRESQMVVAGAQSVVQTHEGEPSGVQLDLAVTDDRPLLRLRAPSGERAEFQVHDIMNRDIPIENGAVRLHVAGYWPDLVMEDGQPSTQSMSPNKPAVLVHVSGHPVVDGEDASPELQLAVRDADTVDYLLLRNGIPYADGMAKVGDQIALGWADWKAEVKQVALHARIGNTLAEAESGGAPGIHAALRAPDGSMGPAEWLVSGQPQFLEKGDQQMRVGFGLETMRLPFAIELLEFRVPRDEGTEQPADFISRVRFHAFDTGARRDATIRMNHPASHPSSWWRTVTGLGFKFSQASWNPENLDETTLQVLHDPGWLFKWIGSLLVCSGIAAMFYFTPRRRAPEDEVGNKRGHAMASLNR